MASFFDLVKRYPELSLQQRISVRNWLRHARYTDLVCLLADPEAHAGLDLALAEQRETQKQRSVGIAAFSILALMGSLAVVCSVWR